MPELRFGSLIYESAVALFARLFLAPDPVNVCVSAGACLCFKRSQTSNADLTLLILGSSVHPLATSRSTTQAGDLLGVVLQIEAVVVGQLEGTS